MPKKHIYITKLKRRMIKIEEFELKNLNFFLHY